MRNNEFLAAKVLALRQRLAELEECEQESAEREQRRAERREVNAHIKRLEIALTGEPATYGWLYELLETPSWKQ